MNNTGSMNIFDNNEKEEKDDKNENEIKNEKEKNSQVVALKYQKSYQAPRIIAKGSGYIAEKILDTAKENDITVHTDKNLAENLIKLELGSDIPPELFEVVAQIYAFIGKIDSILEHQHHTKPVSRNNQKY